MNKITFETSGSQTYPSGYKTTMVNVLVDDKPLAEYLEAYEKPFAQNEGHPNLAGDYHPIEVATTRLKEYYLGEYEKTEGLDKNKTMLLGCSCGVSGCWPLLCKISITSNTVTWSDFEQPHRDDDWDYSRFPGFTFAKQQYLDSIEKSKNS